jgi:protein-tyrosine-phosphatase/8-oxo-dGTP pyrophosphatase MutT (NUDIX family)
MIVMFVCMGNTYRSRLAEVYLKSLAIPGVEVQSAGVAASENLNGRITSYAQGLIEEFELERYSKPTWDALKQNRLSAADIVVCMNRSVYQAAEAAGFKMPLRTFIWDVADVSNLILHGHQADIRVPHIARQTYVQIMNRVNELTTYLRRPAPKELIDVLKPDGSLTGMKANVDEIHTKGLWHRGAHALVYTDAGEVLLEKRSTAIINNPGLWDLTMGGISSAGESPDVTLVRELEEELGIKATPKQIKKLFVWRYNHYLPHYGLHSRSLTHTYLVRVPKISGLKLQPSEVETTRLLTFQQASQFIQQRRAKLGSMITTTAYFGQILKAAELDYAEHNHIDARA